MLAKSCSLFIYYQKGPGGGPGTLFTEGVYSSEVGINNSNKSNHNDDTNNNDNDNTNIHEIIVTVIIL